MSIQNTTIQRKLAFFHSLSKTMVEDSQNVFNSRFKSSHNVLLDEVWSDSIAYASGTTEALNEASINPAVTFHDKVTLTPIFGSNNQAYYFDDAGEFIRPWIAPTDIPEPITNDPSLGYVIRLYDEDDNLITGTDGNWEVNYYAGIIHFQPGSTPPQMGWGAIKASFFAYTGGYGASGTTDVNVENIGLGEGIFRNITGTTINLRSIIGSGDTTVSTSGDTIVVYSEGGTGDGEAIRKIITQISHGFEVQDVIGFSGSTYNQAIADGTYDGEVVGIVSAVIDDDNFEITQAGYVDTLSGLTQGTTYFVSDDTEGLLTSTIPTEINHIVNAILVADSTTSGWVLPYPGYVITTGATGITQTAIENVGVGEGIFRDITGDTVNLRSIIGSGDTTVFTSGDTIVIHSIATTGGTDNITASNGIVRIGDDIQLGGALTDNVVISGSSNSFELLGLNEFRITIDDGTGVSIGDNAGLVYDGDYEETFTGRSLVTKQYVDRAVGIIEEAMAGETLFLPSGATEGDKYIIVDVSGDAETNPIKIYSTTHNINSTNIIPNNIPAEINTDFGSITLYFNSQEFWSVIGFTN